MPAACSIAAVSFESELKEGEVALIAFLAASPHNTLLANQIKSFVVLTAAGKSDGLSFCAGDKVAG